MVTGENIINCWDSWSWHSESQLKQIVHKSTPELKTVHKHQQLGNFSVG